MEGRNVEDGHSVVVGCDDRIPLPDVLRFLLGAYSLVTVN